LASRTRASQGHCHGQDRGHPEDHNGSHQRGVLPDSYGYFGDCLGRRIHCTGPRPAAGFDLKKCGHPERDTHHYEAAGKHRKAGFGQVSGREVQ
ncbi:hypothetical protein BGZ70_006783, partial [Mortierella alpina]